MRTANTLDGPFGAVGMPDSDPIPSSDSSWLFTQSDPSIAEVAFWFHRVQALSIKGNLTSRRIDTGTIETLNVNRVVERAWADETEPARTTVGDFRLVESGIVLFNFLGILHDITQRVPDGWRMKIQVNFGFPSGARFGSVQGGDNDASAATAVLRGTDLVGKRNYEHTLAIYDSSSGGNTYSFGGTLIIEPYLFRQYAEKNGDNPLYDFATGAPLREDFLAL